MQILFVFTSNEFVPFTFLMLFLNDIARTVEIHTKKTELNPRNASGAPKSIHRTRPSLKFNKNNNNNNNNKHHWEGPGVARWPRRAPPEFEMQILCVFTSNEFAPLTFLMLFTPRIRNANAVWFYFKWIRPPYVSSVIHPQNSKCKYWMLLPHISSSPLRF